VSSLRRLAVVAAAAVLLLAGCAADGESDAVKSLDAFEYRFADITFPDGSTIDLRISGFVFDRDCEFDIDEMGLDEVREHPEEPDEVVAYVWVSASCE
jgi:hypothetical protein